MDFFNVIQNRHSNRHFEEKDVEPDKLQKLMETANQAPSAGNLQAYEVYIVESITARIALAKAAYNQEFIVSAPIAIVFCTNPARNKWRYHERGAQLYTIQDATIACTYVMLAATALGLGSVWVGAFDDEMVARIIESPPGVVPVAILPIGYPAGEIVDRPRRELHDLVHGAIK